MSKKEPKGKAANKRRRDYRGEFFRVVDQGGKAVEHGEFATGSSYCKCGKKLSDREHLLRHIKLMANKAAEYKPESGPADTPEPEAPQAQQPERASKDDIVDELITQVTASLFLMYGLDKVKTIGFIESTRLLIHQKFVVETNYDAWGFKVILAEIKQTADAIIREAVRGH